MKHLFLLLGALILNGAAHAVELTLIRSDLTQPLLVTHAGDGSNRLFFIEKAGRIRVQVPGESTTRLFLDIAAKVTPTGGERGLLGLAFHPDYENNRRFFVNYTRVQDGAITIAEYVASPDNANVALTTERVLLTIPHPLGNHNGGMIAFGPDGFLYIAVGDGGGSNDPNNNAQNKNVLLGKILRIDVNSTAPGLAYAIPPDNPLTGATAGRDEIYALGLRNPWRFSFDRGGGRLWCGDVGQGAREEINIISRGGNYGWRIYEGTRCTGLNDGCGVYQTAPPLYEYGHDQGCSITGGYVYRGRKNTLPLGAYVFADYCAGTISLYHRGAASLLLSTGENISSFGEDEAGEIYVATLGGSIYRLDGAIASVQPLRMVEGNSGTAEAVFMVQLSSPAPHPVNLSFTTRNGTAIAGQDYQARTDILIFAPGETQKQVRIPVIGDTIIERDETFLLRLPRAYGVRVSDASRGTATIVNDDS
jgi:glucose/arabinose dehydrogenase